MFCDGIDLKVIEPSDVCTTCKFYKKTIKSTIQGGLPILLCSGENIDKDNCKKHDNYRGII
jgi:hypothetical protein